MPFILFIYFGKKKKKKSCFKCKNHVPRFSLICCARVLYIRNNFNASSVFTSRKKESENQRVKCFFILFHKAHMLHTNLIPYGRCPVHILRKGKKIHFWKPKLVPIPVPGTIRPPEESDLISRQFPSKISATNTNASFANKVPITSYFIFSCFAAGGYPPPPLPSSMTFS